MPFAGIDAGPLYRDRQEAAGALASSLLEYRGQRPVVFGIPRGGVPLAAEIARQLEGDLDVVVARKLGAPFSEELAIGAVTAEGGRFLNEEIIRELGIDPAYVEQVTKAQLEDARAREQRFREGRPPTNLKGRVAIVVDDGLATGATMRAAVRAIRARQPAKLVVAVPVGSREACAALRGEADSLVCPAEPEPFGAVGIYYRHFEPVSDRRVQEILGGRY
jgi:putative phosphoribosyl transferase